MSDVVRLIFEQRDSLSNKEALEFVSVLDSSSQKIAKGRGQKRFASQDAIQLLYAKVEDTTVS